MMKRRRHVFTTATTRLVANLTSPAFLDYAATQWRTFNEFFGLLFAVACQGHLQRALLRYLHVDLFLLDFYLGQASPLSDTSKKPREPMGNKQLQPDFGNLIGTVSVLVRTYLTTTAAKGAISPWTIMFKNESDAQMIAAQHEHAARNSASETFDFRVGLNPDVIPVVFPTDLRTLLTCDQLITQALSRGDNPVAFAEMMCHLCWRHGPYSLKAIPAVLVGMETGSFVNLAYYFTVRGPSACLLRVCADHGCGCVCQFWEKFLLIDDAVKARRIQSFLNGVEGKRVWRCCLQKLGCNVPLCSLLWAALSRSVDCWTSWWTTRPSTRGTSTSASTTWSASLCWTVSLRALCWWCLALPWTGSAHCASTARSPRTWWLSPRTKATPCPVTRT